jgi:hypothetical protein
MNKATISIALSMCLLSSVSKGAVNKEMLERNLGSLDLCYAEYEAVSATKTNEFRLVYSKGEYCVLSILGDNAFDAFFPVNSAFLSVQVNSLNVSLLRGFL